MYCDAQVVQQQVLPVVVVISCDDTVLELKLCCMLAEKQHEN